MMNTTPSSNNPESRQPEFQAAPKNVECSIPCRDCPDLEKCAEACPLAKAGAVAWDTQVSHPLLGGFLIFLLVLWIELFLVYIDLIYYKIIL